MSKSHRAPAQRGQGGPAAGDHASESAETRDWRSVRPVAPSRLRPAFVVARASCWASSSASRLAGAAATANRVCPSVPPTAEVWKLRRMTPTAGWKYKCSPDTADSTSCLAHSRRKSSLFSDSSSYQVLEIGILEIAVSSGAEVGHCSGERELEMLVALALLVQKERTQQVGFRLGNASQRARARSRPGHLGGVCGPRPGAPGLEQSLHLRPDTPTRGSTMLRTRRGRAAQGKQVIGGVVIELNRSASASSTFSDGR